MEITYSLENLPEVASKILKEAQYKIILFNAPMGAGKTTLIKELVKSLGVNDITSSPTFSIVNEYASNTNDKIYHFDMYRINEEEEALDFGIEEYFYSNHFCFVEWPDKIPNLIPTEHHVIEIDIINDTTRHLTMK